MTYWPKILLTFPPEFGSAIKPPVASKLSSMSFIFNHSIEINNSDIFHAVVTMKTFGDKNHIEISAFHLVFSGFHKLCF